MDNLLFRVSASALLI